MFRNDPQLLLLTSCSATFAKAADFDKIVQNDSSAQAFRPPGDLVTSYSRKGRNFEIWSGPLLDSRVRETIQRMQIFISFFIEAGTPLNTTDASILSMRKP